MWHWPCALGLPFGATKSNVCLERLSRALKELSALNSSICLCLQINRLHLQKPVCREDRSLSVPIPISISSWTQSLIDRLSERRERGYRKGSWCKNKGGNGITASKVTSYNVEVSRDFPLTHNPNRVWWASGEERMRNGKVTQNRS